MLAQTVVCPSCRTELRLKSAPPPGVTTAKCPKCGGLIPLTPPTDAPTLTHAPPHPASDTDASVADHTRRTATAPATPAHFPFLAPPKGPDELGRLGHYRVLAELG